jgi:hypothetical protein
MDGYMFFKASQSPCGIDVSFDLTCTSRFKVIGTDHRCRTSSTWLESLDHQSSGPRIPDFKHMPSTRSLNDVASVMPEFFHIDPWSCRVAGYCGTGTNEEYDKDQRSN